MNPASPIKSPLVTAPSLEASLGSSESAGSLKRDSSLGSDSQEGTPKGRRTPSPSRPKAALRAPKGSNGLVRTVSEAQAKIAAALAHGGVARLQAVLKQADKGHRLAAVLAGGAGVPTYARLLDHLHAAPADAELHALVPPFGADLLQAALESQDLPRFETACHHFAARLPELVQQDAARVFESAAMQPAAMQTLLRQLPTAHWDALLSANKGAALVYLWDKAVGAAGPDAAEGDRAHAWAPLLQVFAGADVGLLNRLHHSVHTQRYIAASKRKCPELLRALGSQLKARGGVVPWGEP